MNQIQVIGVYFQFHEEDTIGMVLNNMNLSIQKGEFVAILGHNGSGKSTLAKHLNGIYMPNAGDVWVGEINTKDTDSLFKIRQNVGMVFQNPDNQIVATMVEEDVAFALENLGVSPADIRKRIDWAMKATDVYHLREQVVHQLSGGQKQRVAIAGVLAMKPNFLVLDEPTAMLDPRGRKEVMNIIRKLNQEQGITIVLVTHYMEEAVQASRVIIMEQGTMVLDDTPQKVFSKVEQMKEMGLDVPQSTELLYELKQKGYHISEDVLDPKEAAQAILCLMGEEIV